jgi:hypothetical protein
MGDRCFVLCRVRFSRIGSGVFVVVWRKGIEKMKEVRASFAFRPSLGARPRGSHASGGCSVDFAASELTTVEPPLPRWGAIGFERNTTCRTKGASSYATIERSEPPARPAAQVQQARRLTSDRKPRPVPLSTGWRHSVTGRSRCEDVALGPEASGWPTHDQRVSLSTR